MTSETTAPGLLDRERIVAGPGFSCWLVPPAALCVHLCIGQAYAFSVFSGCWWVCPCYGSSPTRSGTR